MSITDLSRRRRDLTPCLLFPELGERGGGLARAVVERASLYARHYEQVLILTTGFSPKIDQTVVELVERGSLDPRVRVRNFFRDSSWVQSLGVPSAPVRTDVAAAGEILAEEEIVSHRQRMPGGPFLRIADRYASDLYPHRYRYFDLAGQPLVTTRTIPGSKHEHRATVHGAEPLDIKWGTIVAEWVDDEIDSLVNPVLFSLQRGFNDPVLFASKKAVRKVASLHNCHYHDPEDPASGIKTSFRPLLSRHEAIDQIVCLTEQQRHELEIDVPRAPIRAIPYPGRPPRVEPGPKDPTLVVFVTQLIDRKRVDHAIRAFALVVQTVPQARLEIYGSGPAQPALQRLIDDLGLQRSVTLMGYSLTVNQAQARAACTLLTSTFEGFARVISESMSHGTPVIAYDIRYGPRDLIRHGVDGLLVTVQQPEALAVAIVGLLSDPERAREMGARASEVIDRFPIEDFEQAWLDVLRPSLLDRTIILMRRSDLVRGVGRRLRATVGART